MTKKDFKQMISFHQYGKFRRESSLTAIFFDWKTGDYNENGIDKSFSGFKYCVWGRSSLTTKAELEKVLFEIVTGVIEDTPYYIQLIIAQTDAQRFKVPLVSSGLTRLIKWEKV